MPTYTDPLLPDVNWQTLTEAINEIRSTNSFLTRLLYPPSVEQYLPTETIEIGSVIAGREMAPLVKANGEAILVGGTSKKFATVTAPNIRMKQPMQASKYMFNRQPGSPIQLRQGETQLTFVQQKIAEDVAFMRSLFDNRLEWMVAQSLQGAISYLVEDQEAIEINIPRDPGNSIILIDFWDGVNAAPLKDIHTVKRVLSDIPGAEGLAPTDAICGSEAASALLTLVEQDKIKVLDRANVSAGAATFVEQFNDSGAIYLGSLGGVRFWEYGRTATDESGAVVSMIRPKWIEFVNTGPTAGRKLYFGAVPDWDFDSGLGIGKIFSKSWLQKDPSVLFQLLHSRPLPWPRRPNASVSMKVVSG